MSTARYACRGLAWEELHADLQPWGARWHALSLVVPWAENFPPGHELTQMALSWLRGPTFVGFSPLGDRACEEGFCPDPRDFVGMARRYYFNLYEHEFDSTETHGWICVDARSYRWPKDSPVWSLPPRYRPDQRAMNYWRDGDGRHVIFPSRASALAAAAERNRRPFAFSDWLGLRGDDARTRVFPYRGIPNAHRHPDLIGYVHAHPPASATATAVPPEPEPAPG